MERKDYEKFIDIFKSEQYEIFSFKKTPWFPSVIARVSDKRTIEKNDNINKDIWKNKNKVLGIHIDVLPIDNVPDNDGELKVMLKNQIF